MLCQTLNAEYARKGVHVAHVIIDGVCVDVWVQDRGIVGWVWGGGGFLCSVRRNRDNCQCVAIRFGVGGIVRACIRLCVHTFGCACTHSIVCVPYACLPCKPSGDWHELRLCMCVCVACLCWVCMCARACLRVLRAKILLCRCFGHRRLCLQCCMHVCGATVTDTRQKSALVRCTRVRSY